MKVEKKCIKEGEKKLDEEKKFCLFVLDFNGDVYVYVVSVLCCEIIVVFLIVKLEDEVLFKFESFGGVVYGYGLVVL